MSDLVFGIVEPLFAAIASGYTLETHLFLLKAGGLLCGWGDIAALMSVLRVVELVRGRRPAFRLWTLRAFLALNAAPLFAPDLDKFYIALFITLGVPYLMLAYTAVTEASAIIDYIKRGRAARE